MARLLTTVCSFSVCSCLLLVPGQAAEPAAQIQSDTLSISATLEAIRLWRSGERGFQVTTGSANLTSGQLDPLNSSGLEARFAVAHGAFGISGRYLDTSGSASGTDPAATALLTTPPVNFSAREVGVDVGSRARSHDINAFWQMNPRLRLLIGYRSIEIDETFLANIGGGSALGYSVENSLQGAQLAIEARLLGATDGQAGPYLDGAARVGLYANNRRFAGTTSGIGGALAAFGGSDGPTAVVGEAELRLGYLFHRNLAAHLGYRALFVDNAATALGNLQSFNITTGVGGIVGQALLYHGISGGASLHF